MYDAIVVGAGPSGARISANLASKGFKVLMIDLKSEIGVPNHCSGLVDERVVKLVGYDLVIDKPEQAEIITPLSSFFLYSKKMFVIDRIRLDKQLSEIAQSYGADISLRRRFFNYSLKDHEIHVLTSGNGGFMELKTRFLIGSDGPLSQVRNLSRIKSPKLLPSVQFDVASRSEEVKLYLDRTKTPEFFSWEIPHNGETEIGASGIGSLDTVASLASDRKIINKRGGIIPLGPTDLGTGNVFLTGDSAGLSKATTGGGLYAALKSSDSLSEAILTEGNILKNYRRIWYSNFGKEIKRDFMLRRLIDRFEKYYQLWIPFSTANIEGINSVGDIDYPSKLLLYILAASPLKINEIIKDIILLSDRNHNYSK